MTQTTTADPKQEEAPAAETPQAEAPQAEAPPTEAPAVEVSDAELAEAAPVGTAQAAGQINVLLDTKVRITAALGSVTMPVRQLLELGPGAVIALDRVAGDPVDLYLNDILFATGTLVCVGEHLGVRIKEIVRPTPVEAVQAPA